MLLASILLAAAVGAACAWLAGLLWGHIWPRVQRGERPAFSKAEAAKAPAGYVALMQELWDQDPVTRPTFEVSFKRLTQLKEQLVSSVRRKYA